MFLFSLLLCYLLLFSDGPIINVCFVVSVSFHLIDQDTLFWSPSKGSMGNNVVDRIWKPHSCGSLVWSAGTVGFEGERQNV